MKTFIVGLFMAMFFSFSVQSVAQVPLSPGEVVLDSNIIGGNSYYTIALMADSAIVSVRVAYDEIKEAPPATSSEWFLLILKIITSGLLASLIAQGTRVFVAAKNLISKLPRGEWIVAIFSIAIGAVWLYLETKFVGFSIMALFVKTAQAFFVAIIAWRAGLSRVFIKPESANTNSVETAVETVLKNRGII